VVEQKCECPSGTHGHMAGECSRPATRPDQRCDTCRDEAATEEMLMVKEEPIHEPSRHRGLSDAVRSTTTGENKAGFGLLGVDARGQAGTLFTVENFGLHGVAARAEAGSFVVHIDKAASTVVLRVSSIIIPERRTNEGILIRSTGALWAELANQLGADWSVALELTPTQWEEMVAGAFKKAGYDDVTLTPRSRDRGRDVIATQ
jgi:hypothetical protein